MLVGIALSTDQMRGIRLHQLDRRLGRMLKRTFSKLHQLPFAAEVFPSTTLAQQNRTGTAPNSDFPREEPTDVRPDPNLQRRPRHGSAGYAPSLDVPLWHHCASVTLSSPPGGPLALRRQLLSLPLRSWRRSCTNMSRNIHTVNPTGPAW